MVNWYPRWDLNPFKFSSTDEDLKINDKKQTSVSGNKRASTNITPKDHKNSGGSHRTSSSSYRHGSSYEPNHSSSHRHHRSSHEHRSHGSSRGRSSHSYGHGNSHKPSHGHGHHGHNFRHGHNIGSISNYTIARTGGSGTSGKICGDPKYGANFICTADYNSRIQSQSVGYPVVTLRTPQTGSRGYGYHGR